MDCVPYKFENEKRKKNFLKFHKYTRTYKKKWTKERTQPKKKRVQMQIIILIKIHYNVRDYYIIFYKLNFRFFFIEKLLME